MLHKESTDKEILDFPIANTTVRNIGTISFLGWVANKLNGVEAYKAATQELLGLVKNAPMGKMPEEERVKTIRKMLSIDVKF